MRRLISVALGVIMCSCVVAADVDLEPYREAMERLLADEATPGIELPEELEKLTVGEERGWPDMVGFSLQEDRAGLEGYAVIDAKAETLIGFTEHPPEPPVPMDVMAPEDAVPIAEEFCERHFPELFAEGGEVVVSVDEQILPTGARIVHLQRTVKGVKAPRLAEVGVRVYDGKVVHYRHRNVALDESLELPGVVTEQRAKEIATDSIPWKKMLPVFWFDVEHKVVVTDQGQRNIWSLWAELKQNAASRKLERFNYWQIDANTEQIITNEWSKPTRELRVRYRAAAAAVDYEPSGGPLTPDPIFTDSDPVPSPDGAQVLFRSDRPREGYPLWLKRPKGLFVIKTDGSDMRCVVPGLVKMPTWSPDGKRIAYVDAKPHAMRGGEDFVVADADGGNAIRMMPDKPWSLGQHAWVPDGRIVWSLSKFGVESKMVLVDPAKPHEKPVELPAKREVGESIGGLLADEQERLLYTTRHSPMTPTKSEQRRKNPYKLWRMEPVGPEGKSELLVEYLETAKVLAPGGEGKLIAGDLVGGWAGTGVLIAKLNAGTSEVWSPPHPLIKKLPYRWAVEPSDVRFMPDGETMVFSAQMWNRENPTRAPAVLLWTCKKDGDDLEPLTPWDDSPVELLAAEDE